MLAPGFESFVGPHSLPLRHGLSAGEFARMVNRERKLGARLEVDCGDAIPPRPNARIV